MIFTLAIKTTKRQHFGDTPTAEARVLESLLLNVRQAVGTAGPGAEPHPVTLHGDVVGSWSWGPDSMNAR